MIDELIDRAKQASIQVQVEVGRVGWDSRDSHFDRGEPSGPRGDRHTLVLVTLFRGQSPGDGGVGDAAGYQIYARLNGLSGQRVPPKGTIVYLIIPHGMEEVPGAAMIVGAFADDHNDNLANGEVVFAAAEGAAKIVLRNDGTICLLTTTDNTPTGKVVALSLSPTALKITAPWGSETFDATGYHVKTKHGPRLDMGGINIPLLPSELSGPLTGYFTITAPTIKLAGAGVFLGAGTVYNPALWAAVSVPSPPPIPVAIGASIQTQTVWVAP